MPLKYPHLDGRFRRYRGVETFEEDKKFAGYKASTSVNVKGGQDKERRGRGGQGKKDLLFNNMATVTERYNKLEQIAIERSASKS